MQEQEGYKSDGSASPEELRLWVETQFPGILKLTILGKPRAKARLERMEKAKVKAQKTGKKQKTSPEPPPSPINIPDHEDHLLHSLLTDANIGSGIFMMKRVDGQSHFLSFSGAGEVFSDREGHVYRVGTLKQLTQTLIDAGYVWGDHPGAGLSPTFISAMVLLVNVRSINLRHLNSIYLREHSSWDLSASGSTNNMEPTRRAGYTVIKTALEDLLKARRFQPGAQVKVHVNGKVRDARFIGVNGDGEYEFKVQGWVGWTWRVTQQHAKSNVICTDEECAAALESARQDAARSGGGGGLSGASASVSGPTLVASSSPANAPAFVSPFLHFTVANADHVSRPGREWAASQVAEYTQSRFSQFKINGEVVVRPVDTAEWSILSLCVSLQLTRKIAALSNLPLFDSMIVAAVKNPVVIKQLHDYSLDNDLGAFSLTDDNMAALDAALAGELGASARTAQQHYAVQTTGIYGNDAKPSWQQQHITRTRGAGAYYQSLTPVQRNNINVVMSMAFSGDTVDPDQLKDLVFRIIQGQVPKLENGGIVFAPQQPLCVIGTGVVGLDISLSYHYESIARAVAFASGKPTRAMRLGDKLAFRKSPHARYAAEDEHITRKYGRQFSLAGYAIAMGMDVWELGCQVCLRAS